MIAAPVGRGHPDRCQEVLVLEGGPRSATRAPRVRGGPGGLSTTYVPPLSTDLLPQVMESTHFPLRVSSFLLWNMVRTRKENGPSFYSYFFFYFKF